MLELKVYNPEDSFLKRIEWNYEELKSYIEPISAEYAASVYTDDMIKKAKEDRIKLNKFKDALEAEKSRVRKKVMEPYETFRLEVDDLTALSKKRSITLTARSKAMKSACVRKRQPRSESSMRITSMTLASIFRLNV